MGFYLSTAFLASSFIQALLYSFHQFSLSAKSHAPLLGSLAFDQRSARVAPSHPDRRSSSALAGLEH